VDFVVADEGFLVREGDRVKLEVGEGDIQICDTIPSHPFVAPFGGKLHMTLFSLTDTPVLPPEMLAVLRSVATFV